MTTYDDADLFSDAFTGFRGVSESRHRSRTVGVLALAVAAALVAAALVWVRLSQEVPAAAADPSLLVPVLAQPQHTADVIAVADRTDLLISPESTRLLLRDDAAAYYAAQAPGDQLCLVVVPSGDLARTACESTAGSPDALRLDDVLLVPAGATVPDAWRQVAANVFVQD
jgi:hypothetical protein